MEPADLAASGSLLSPVTLFMNADIIVKLVMIGLLAASLWTWTVILGHSVRLRGIYRKNEGYEQDFWAAQDMQRFVESTAKSDVPNAKVLASGINEWRRSTGANRPVDKEGTRARLTTALGSSVAAEVDRMGEKLNILATVGSVSPFVGLFGTVWGIMRSFTDIAANQNTNLAVVAPGIAEALFATALGLFAAIPAVIAYNRMTHHLNRIEGRMNHFADGVHNLLSRELEALR